MNRIRQYFVVTTTDIIPRLTNEKIKPDELLDKLINEYGTNLIGYETSYLKAINLYNLNRIVFGKQDDIEYLERCYNLK